MNLKLDKPVVKANDKYERFMTKGVFSIGKGPSVHNSKADTRLNMNVSYDKFEQLIKATENMPDQEFKNITIYDGAILRSREDYLKRIKMLKTIEGIKSDELSFILSDSTMGFYHEIMSRMRYEDRNVNSEMSINRNPMSLNYENLNLEKAPGSINIDELDLIHVPLAIIKQLDGKVSERVLQDTIELQKLITEYYQALSTRYDMKNMHDFGKIILTYQFVRQNIRFASEVTRIADDGRMVKIDNYPLYVDEAYGTYINRSGVCTGQSNLMTVLLNNRLMNVETTTLVGNTKLGFHQWSGTVVDNRLFEHCTTMGGSFNDLGYELASSQQYPELYEQSHLTESDKKRIETHVKKMKR